MGDYLSKCPKCPNDTYLSGEGALLAHYDRAHKAWVNEEDMIEPTTGMIGLDTDYRQNIAGPEDDFHVALIAASNATGALIGQANFLSPLLTPGCPPIAEQIAAVVIGVADEFVRWLRRLAKVSVRWAVIENEETGEVIRLLPEGATMALILTGQRGRAVINAADSRGFPVDATLAVKVTDADGGPSNVVTAEIVEATTGTASGKDELVVHVGSEAGSALVTVFSPANDAVFGSVAVDVAGNPDDVTHIDLGGLVVEAEDVTPPTEPTTPEAPAEPTTPETPTEPVL